MLRSAVSSCALVLTVAVIHALPIRVFAAEIAGAIAQVHALKPPERVPEPKYAPASDEPLKAMKKFQLPAGFRSALWASEPLLGNPVAFCFDEQGRAFVAETFRYRTSVLDIRHYMLMLEDDLASRSTDDRIAFTKKHFPNDWQKLEIETEIVRLVEDKDGDGRAEVSSVYAGEMKTLLDGINSGVLAYNGRLWCTNIPNLWQFTGLTRDGKAEKRESLSFGYGVRYSFTGHDMHGLALGPDGRLYFSFGDRGAHVRTKEGNTLPFPDEGAVFRCEQDGTNLEVVYRGLRNPQELAFDNHGNLFTGDNDCDQGDRERWVYIVEGGDAGWRVGWQHPPLGKDHNMWLTEHIWEPRDAAKIQPAYILSPILNIPDGPSGVVHNPGTGLPAQFDDAFFVCGFKGSSARSAISWWKVKEHGAGFAVEKSPAVFVDNVQATDVDFGPDSKIYFTEWGEGWEGTGRGRIFRLENAEVQKAQAGQIAEVRSLIGGELLKKSTAQLAPLLAHNDQRVRLRAQWALASRRQEAVPTLLTAAGGGFEGPQRALSQLHGIWGLAQVVRSYSQPFDEGFFQTRWDEIGKALLALAKDTDPEVRAQAAWVMGETAAGELKEPLLALLTDPQPRVKFFAGLALTKFARKWVQPPGKGARIELAGVARSIAEAAVRLAQENADRDEFLRHAAVMMLTSAADDPAITAAAAHPSRSVRLAALLAMRRLGKVEIARFLDDTDPGVALEAARAINDEGMADAWTELAKLIGKPIPEERLMLRVLNANLRAGTPENAQALASYAADQTQPEFLRTEALKLLGTWPQPFRRDRVAGVFRPIPDRGAAPALTAIQTALPKLLAVKSPSVVIAALETAAALRAKGAGPGAFALVGRKDLQGKVRAAALKTLAAIDDPRAAEAVRLAIADRDVALRVEAVGLLGKLNPDEATAKLAKAFATAGAAEKKAIITALGELKSAQADQVLAGLFAELKTGKVPNEALLELLEAAEKRGGAELKAHLGAYQNSLPQTEPLAKYAYALAGGDAENGEKLFKEHAVAQCTRCHKVDEVGGEAGPDLTGIAAKKDRRYLLESLVLPNAQIAEGFQTVMVTLKNDDLKAGIVKAETAESVTLQMPIPDAPVEVVKKAEIKLRENAPSGMPPGMGELLTKRELRDILEYVASLKNP